MIEIQQEKKQSKQEFLDLLLDQKVQPFEIYIPKSTQLYFSATEDIADDYITLAIVGQMLKDFSDEFDYDVVPTHEHESALFTIKTKRFEELAEVLLEISYFFGNEDPDDDEFRFWNAKDEFLADIENPDFIVACPEYVEIYFETLEDLEQDEDEDEAEDN